MKITPYDFAGKTVRILIDDKGDPWWVAFEVCCVLGHPNTSQVTSALYDDEKGLQKMDTPGGKQELLMVNEAGLYSIIINSHKKRAKKFKRWITHDILPTIRKTGSYSLKNKPQNEIEWIEYSLKLAKEKEAALIENKKLLPKADALDQIATCDGLASFTKAGKILGIKPHELVKLLELHKVLYRTKDARKDILPFQYYMNHNWFKVKSVGPEKKYTQTLITQFGLTKLGTRFSRFFEKEK